MPDAPMLTHGTRYGYQRGCRCVRCRAANAGYSQARREKNRLALEPEQAQTQPMRETAQAGRAA